MWIAGMSSVDKAIEGLGKLFPGSKKTLLHNDFALILCFLSDRRLFEHYFRDMSDDMDRYYRMGRTLEFKNNLTAAFVRGFRLIDRCSDGGVGAFQHARENITVRSNKDAQNIALTGNALNLFGGIVSKGYLFKDATGPSHGEYAHTIQWLTIAYAKYYGVIKLKTPVVELYKNAAGLPFSTRELNTLDADSDLAASLKLPYWSLLVDCFRSSELHGSPEEFGENLFVENYRSPSYLTDQMLHRRLGDTFLGRHLQERYAKRRDLGFKTGLGKRGEVRQYTIDKQQKKRALIMSGPTTNSTAPLHTPDTLLSDLRQRTSKHGGTLDGDVKL